MGLVIYKTDINKFSTLFACPRIHYYLTLMQIGQDYKLGDDTRNYLNYIIALDNQRKRAWYSPVSLFGLNKDNSRFSTVDPSLPRTPSAKTYDSKLTIHLALKDDSGLQDTMNLSKELRKVHNHSLIALLRYN